MENITLIGMAASGKSTMGKLLAKELDLEFVDGDVEIEKRGRMINDILNKEGDDAFMLVEEQVLCELDGNKKLFAPGGSCILSKKAMQHLKKISKIVFVDVPFEIIEKRFDKNRMNIIVGLKGNTLKQVYDYRKPIYARYADVTVTIDGHGVTESVQLILEKIYKGI